MPKNLHGGGGEALGRANRATGEAEPVVVAGVADRETGRRTSARASTFEVTEPGDRGGGAGPEGSGNRATGTAARMVWRSNRATGEVVERSGGRAGQPGRLKEKGIARRGASSDGR